MFAAKQMASTTGKTQFSYARVGESILARIGNTPLLRLVSIGHEFQNVEICGKAEWFNPGGSVKDRRALGRIDACLKSGALVPGKTIIDATSGNTGIAYAMIGAALGYPVTLCLPDSASHERKRMLTAYGATLEITPGDEATEAAFARGTKWSRPTLKNISTPTSTATLPTGNRTITAPPMKFGSRPQGA